MSMPPVDMDDVIKLKAYHAILKEQFRRGKLKGKMKILLKDEADFIGISMSSYWAHVKKLCHGDGE